MNYSFQKLKMRTFRFNWINYNKANWKTSKNKPVQEIKSETTFDDFSKMDIRTATILEAEAVPKTDKLLKLLLDTGVDKRTVVSGIAQYYKPQDVIGQKVCLLANLAPRKIKGIEKSRNDLDGRKCKWRIVFCFSHTKRFSKWLFG